MPYWIIELDDGRIEQSADAPGTMGTPEGVRSAELPRLLDLATEAWDWTGGAIVSRFTPAEAVAIMWERAKACCEQRQTEPVSIADIIEGDVIVAQRDEKGQKWIDRFTGLAGAALIAQQPFEISFTDGDNRYFTIDATQIIQLSAASCLQQSLCHAVSQGVRAALAAALEAGATADEIFAIDITAGYPSGPISPPTPPEQES